MASTSIPFWTYILENPDGRFYIGHADNLERRLAEHNADEKVGRKYTHKNGPWPLVWSEPHLTRGEAVRREPIGTRSVRPGAAHQDSISFLTLRRLFPTIAVY